MTCGRSEMYGSYNPATKRVRAKDYPDEWMWERARLPELPPVSHLELGRQEAFGFPDRRRDPFDGATNACLEFDGPAEPVTVESLAHAYAALVEAVGPLPHPFPVVDRTRVRPL